MTIIKRNGQGANGFSGMFDDFFSRDLFNWNQQHFSNTQTNIPSVNIRETNENYLVEVAAPGMRKEDFKLQLEGNILTISSEKLNRQENSTDERWLVWEFSYQSFQRSFTLQKDVVDVDKIQARYEEGVLQLFIPKKETAKQQAPRIIQVA